MIDFLKPAFSHTPNTTPAFQSTELRMPENVSTEKVQLRSNGIFRRFWSHTQQLSKADTKPFEGLL